MRLMLVVSCLLLASAVYAQPAPAPAPVPATSVAPGSEPAPAQPAPPPTGYPPPQGYPQGGYPPPQGGYPPPQPYGYPQNGYYLPQQPLVLTAEDQELLAEGEMPMIQHAGGGALAFFVGFGVGHAVQGRWLERGWLFTAADTLSYAALFVGVRDFSDCIEGPCDNSRAGLLIATGLIGIAGFHIWETLDAFVVPANRNKRVRQLRWRLGLPQQQVRFYVTPHQDGGAIAGMTLRF